MKRIWYLIAIMVTCAVFVSIPRPGDLSLAQDGAAAQKANAAPAAFPPEVKGVLDKHCLPCHAKAKAAVFKTPEALRASNAKARIKAGKMPPAKSAQFKDFGGMERSMLLDFLSVSQ